MAVAGRVEVRIRKSVPANGSISAAAVRMRRHRLRRREGLRSLSIELRETEIDALFRAGLLEEQSRDDSNAVVGALYGLLDRVFRRMARNAARTG
jgi:hypothetical protein